MNIHEDFCKLLEDVREWHEKTFPDAKLNNQLLKLEEELEELEQASTFLEKELEYADVLIVCAGLMRWKSKVGEYIIKNTISNNNLTGLNHIIGNIHIKMAKNKQRVWKKLKNGVYHHE